MGFNGSLDLLSLADVFQNISQNRLTGTLRVYESAREKRIVFSSGAVNYVSASGKHLRLSEILKARGIVSLEDCSSAKKMATAQDKETGSILLELGLITKEQLTDALRYQLEEEVYELFSWQSANYEFDETTESTGKFRQGEIATEVFLPTSSLIMEAARRADEWSRMAQIIPSTREYFRLSKSFVASEKEIQGIGTNELSLVADLIDGASDVEDIISASGLPRFEVMHVMCELMKMLVLQTVDKEDLIDAVGAASSSIHHGKRLKMLERIIALEGDCENIRRLATVAANEAENNTAFEVHSLVWSDYRTAASAYSESIDILGRLLAEMPSSSAAHDRIARAYFSLGRIDEACEHMARNIRLLSDANHSTDAILNAESSMMWLGESSKVLSELADAYRRNNKTREAVLTLDKLADIYLREGHTAQATASLRRLLNLDSGNEKARGKLLTIEKLAKGAEKKHLAFYVRLCGIMLLLLLFGGGGSWEALGWWKFRKVQQRANVLKSEKNYEEALNLYSPLMGRLSFIGLADVVNKERVAIRSIQKKQEDALQKKRDEINKEFRDEFEHAKTSPANRALIDDLFARLSKNDIVEPLLIEDIQQFLASRDDDDKGAASFLSRANDFKLKGDIDSAFFLYRRILREFPLSEVAGKVKLPVRVTSSPAGALVLVDGKEIGKTPLVVLCPPRSGVYFELRQDGFSSSRHVLRDPTSSSLHISLSISPSWTVSLGAVATLNVLAPDNTSIVVAGKKMYRISNENGRILWEENIAVRSFINGKIAIGKTQVYYSLESGAVVARSLKTGAIAWSTMVSGRVTTGVDVFNIVLIGGREMVYCATNNGKVYGVDAKTGRVYRTSKFLERISGEISVIDDGVFVSGNSGTLFCLDLTSLNIAKAWDGRAGSVVGHLSNGFILSERSGYLSWMKKNSDKPIWRTRANVNSVFKKGSNIYAVTDGVQVSCFDAMHGNILWSHKFKTTIVGGVCVTEKNVYAIVETGEITCLEKTLSSVPKIVWTTTLRATPATPLRVNNGWLIVGANDSYLYGYKIKK